jgi:hypothetical protein
MLPLSKEDQEAEDARGLLTGELLVKKCLAAMAHSRLAPTPTARAVLREYWALLDDILKQELACTGLAHIVARTSSNLRTVPVPQEIHTRDIASATQKMATRVGRAIQNHTDNILRGISLQVGTGKMRALYDFTQADLTLWKANAEGHSNGWAARMKWFEHARLVLIRNQNASSLGQLPPKAKREIALAAKQVWKRNVHAH